MSQLSNAVLNITQDAVCHSRVRYFIMLLYVLTSQFYIFSIKEQKNIIEFIAELNSRKIAAEFMKIDVCS